jgi:hypothetical protein
VVDDRLVSVDLDADVRVSLPRERAGLMKHFAAAVRAACLRALVSSPRRIFCASRTSPRHPLLSVLRSYIGLGDLVRGVSVMWLMLLLFFNCVEGLAARDSASDTAAILLLKVGSHPSA